MNQNIMIPDELKSLFQRLMPHFPIALREDPKALEAIILYLKVGGEKLARIAIEAYKQNQRLSYAEAQKRLRETAMSAETANLVEHDSDEVDDEEKDSDDDSDVIDDNY
jgi:hypothetical protein